MVGTRKNEKKNFPAKARLLKKEVDFFSYLLTVSNFLKIEEIENSDFLLVGTKEGHIRKIRAKFQKNRSIIIRNIVTNVSKKVV